MRKPAFFDASLLAALAIAAVALLPRSGLFVSRLSTTVDERYHLTRGLLMLQGDAHDRGSMDFNDAPLGEVLSAVPLAIHGVTWRQELAFVERAGQTPIAGPGSPTIDSLRLQVACWKALLAIPFIGLVFYWLRDVYGLASAWLAVAMLLIEPTFAAHLPLPTVDYLGVEGIALGCWMCWRFASKPTLARCIAASAATALALCLKHTAMILPAVAVLMCIACCIRNALSKNQKNPRPMLAKSVALLALAATLTPLFIWPFTLFNDDRIHVPVEPPSTGDPFDQPRDVPHLPQWLLDHHIPGGIYWSSVLAALEHERIGHRAYLLGQTSMIGWWYYFPVVASYKIPIGVAAILLLGAISFAWRPPRWNELSFAIPAVGWTALMMHSTLNIGFRHFLPAYLFLLLLASRCLMKKRVLTTDYTDITDKTTGSSPIRATREIRGSNLLFHALAATVYLCVLASAIQTYLWFPDYVSFINFPRPAPWLAISDSNIDWGQSLKQIRGWLADHADEHRPIYLGYWGPKNIDVIAYLGNRPAAYCNPGAWHVPDGQTAPPWYWNPSTGLLIVSPVLVTGQYTATNRFAFLQSIAPQQIIGRCMLVYDLDLLKGQGKLPASWLQSAPRAPT